MKQSKRTETKAKPGSPPTGEPDYLVVGVLRRPHGLKGDLIMEVLTDFPERLKPGTAVFVGPAHTRVEIDRIGTHSEGMLIKFAGVQSPEATERYRNQTVYVTTADRPRLPKGQFYEHEVLGFAVVEDETGETIGVLSEIMRTGANDIYVVERADGSEVLLPVIPAVVLALDADRRMIRVHLLPGLIEDRKA